MDLELIRQELNPLTCKFDWKTIVKEETSNNGRCSEKTIATRSASKKKVPTIENNHCKVLGLALGHD
jgi:hypothetical protein